MQQVTRGGGGKFDLIIFKTINNNAKHIFYEGLTLMSQWKSQFDDSEETDNEWKGDNLQSPDHKMSLHGVSLVCIFTNYVS